MRAAVLVLLAAGCGSPFFHALTARSGNVDTAYTHPHSVEYELLGTATGKACADGAALSSRKGASKDPALNGPPALFEQAKFIAIGSVKDADGLAAIRSQAEINEANGWICVTVTGRAYRLTGLRAGHVKE